MAIFFTMYLPAFAAGLALGASVMWCICKAMVRQRYGRRGNEQEKTL